jgi:hypothetical protein
MGKPGFLIYGNPQIVHHDSENRFICLELINRSPNQLNQQTTFKSQKHSLPLPSLKGGIWEL